MHMYSKYICVCVCVCVDIYIVSCYLSTVFHYIRFLLGGMHIAIFFKKPILNYYASITLNINLKLYAHYFLLKNTNNWNCLDVWFP